MGCKPCIEYGGVWCPKGHVVVWINGVRWTIKFSLLLSITGGEGSRGRICRFQQSVKGEL